MSAEAVGRHMPAIASLDDLTAMIAADPHGHRYELSPEGVLSVMRPPGYAHAIVATRIMGWLLAAGIPRTASHRPSACAYPAGTVRSADASRT